jgi:hypothetical protein
LVVEESNKRKVESSSDGDSIKKMKTSALEQEQKIAKLEGVFKKHVAEDGVVEFECEKCYEAHPMSVSEALVHSRTLWLRSFIGQLHDRAASQSEINWDSLAQHMKFPQSGAEMPAFVVAMLSRHYRMHYGSFELQYILDAITRQQNTGCSYDHAEDVHIVSVLEAVYRSRLLNKSSFARFRALFENHLPILTVCESMNPRTKTKMYYCSKPWHSFRTDYLENKNWAGLQFSEEALENKINGEVGDDDNGFSATSSTEAEKN